MISYQQALQILKDNARTALESETIPLSKAVGRRLVDDVYSQEEIPSFNNSAMDGFCINSEWVNRELEKGPVMLPVLGLIAAGDNLEKFNNLKVEACSTIEIMTGAVFPDFLNHASYDTVVKIEDVEVTSDHKNSIEFIKITKPVKPKENVRYKGEDFRKGQLVLSKNQIIQPEHLLALSSLGVFQVPVYKKIKIAIASTGKELVPFSREILELGKIRNSTSLYLQNWFVQKSYKVKNYGIIDDEEINYEQTIKKAFDDDAQIFISTGAVSMGKFDFVRLVLEKMGATIHFHKCAIRPGKPILFASLEYQGVRRFIFGVPGNPVSTAVGARFFILPFLEWLQGEEKVLTYYKARLTEDFKKPEGLRCFFKGVLSEVSGQLQVRALSGQASFRVQPLIESNSWVVFPEENSIQSANSIVEVYQL